MTNTIISKCQSEKCVFSSDNECLLKRVEIKNGKCKKFQSELGEFEELCRLVYDFTKEDARFKEFHLKYLALWKETEDDIF